MQNIIFEKKSNNAQSFDSSAPAFGSTAPVTSSFDFYMPDKELDINMLSSSDIAIAQTLEGLINERKDWEANEYVHSNERLYLILTRCYSLFQEVRGTSWSARAARKSFYRVIEMKGFDIPDTCHLMTKVVWVVFGKKNRRAIKYSNAMLVAAEMKVETKELRNFIQRFGGIDEVVRAKKKCLPRHEKGRAVLYGPIITSIADPAISENIKVNDIYNDTSEMILLARYDEETDVINILRVVQNKAALKACLASLASKVSNDEYDAFLNAEKESTQMPNQGVAL
jgi:hypothetical protein